ncbi:MAG: hypothetical protein RLZZ540_2346 [Bacteroidota bacterium]|jgi:hypothetical protein
MLKIIFYLKSGKANKKGESPIFARISYNQKRSMLVNAPKLHFKNTNAPKNYLSLL